jgi:hypothetical protein
MTLTAGSSVGDQNSVAHATDNGTLTAGGTGDGTEVVGQIFDRSTNGFAQSVLAAINWKAVLAATKTLSIAWHLEHGDAANLSDAADLVNVGAAVVGTGPGGGGTVRGTFGNDIWLGGAKRYIRLKFTPDLSATSVDTAEIAALFVFAQS